MKRFRKITVIFSGLFLTLIILINIYNFVCFKILKKPLAPFFGYAMLEVVSSSMEPTLQKSDYIIIDMKDKKYKKDDIITFYDKEGSFVTHRIVAAEKEAVITKGDHNHTEDGKTKKDKIVGKYIFHIRGAGKVIALLKNPLIVIIIITLIATISYLTMPNEEVVLADTKEYQEFLKYLENPNESRKKISAKKEILTTSIKKNKKNKKRKKRAKRKQRRG